MAITDYEEIEKLDRHEADYMKAGRETIACVTPEMRIWFRDTFGHMDYDYRIKEEWMKAHSQESTTTTTTTEKQVGGDHYKLPIQPIDYIVKNNLGYIEGNIIKYVTRYKSKNGVEDLKKAQHYLEMLIEEEERRDANTN